jgi:hemerythrin superfamily protein
MAGRQATRSTNTTAPRTNAPRSAPDALELLKADHEEVAELFVQFEDLDDDGEAGERQEIVSRACTMLTIHAQLEEEIFYPAVREAVDELDDQLNEAEVEHATVKELIAKLQEMDPDDKMYAAHFTVLSEYVKHHVREEEDELFPEVEDAGLDLDALGAQLMERKEELQRGA